MDSLIDVENLPLTKGCKFYCYHQNNSGGNFNISPESAHYVFIEAHNVDESNKLAVENTEIYFDGCDEGIDCSCCGDRWGRACDKYDASDIPNIYGKSLVEYRGTHNKETAIVFFLNGDRLYCVFGSKNEKNHFALVKKDSTCNLLGAFK